MQPTEIIIFDSPVEVHKFHKNNYCQLENTFESWSN